MIIMSGEEKAKEKEGKRQGFIFERKRREEGRQAATGNLTPAKGIKE